MFQNIIQLAKVLAALGAVAYFIAVFTWVKPLDVLVEDFDMNLCGITAEIENEHEVLIPVMRQSVITESFAKLRSNANNYVIFDDFILITDLPEQGSFPEYKTVTRDGREYLSLIDAYGLELCASELIEFTDDVEGTKIVVSIPAEMHPIHNQEEGDPIILEISWIQERLPNGVTITALPSSESFMFSGIFFVKLKSRALNSYHIELVPIGFDKNSELEVRLRCNALMDRFGILGRILCPLAVFGTG